MHRLVDESLSTSCPYACKYHSESSECRTVSWREGGARVRSAAARTAHVVVACGRTASVFAQSYLLSLSCGSVASASTGAGARSRRAAEAGGAQGERAGAFSHEHPSDTELMDTLLVGTETAEHAPGNSFAIGYTLSLLLS